MEKFIKGYEKKYVITSEGLLYSLFHYSPGLHRKRIDEKKLMNPVSNSKIPPKVLLSDEKTDLGLRGGKFEGTTILKLMVRVFNIEPPDLNYFRYELAFRDRNPHNASLSNLYWKDLKDTIADFDNILFDDYHRPLGKICPCCREFLHIDNFNRLKKNHENYYRVCYSCTKINDTNLKTAIERNLQLGPLENSEELDNLINLQRKKLLLWQKLKRAESTQSDSNVKK